MSKELLKNIDGYPVVKEIGHGISGAVYQVRLPGRQRFAALKLFTGVIDPVELLRFKREFGAIARCRHPGIVSVYGIGEYNNRPYILMEYVKGKPLDEAIRNNLRVNEPLPRSYRGELIEALVQILDILDYLHGQKIIHRDIKPANLIITNENKVKLLDFGMAWNQKSVAEDDAGGTAGYQAPELLLVQSIDPRSDLYSVGICLYEVITGFHPFGKWSSWKELLDRQLNRKYNPLSVLNPAFGEGWEYFTEKLMNNEPTLRYQSALQALTDLSKRAELDDLVTVDSSEKQSWGLLESVWIGKQEQIEKAVKSIQNKKNFLFEAPNGAGRTRFLKEIEKSLGDKFLKIHVNSETHPVQWMKNLLSGFQTESIDGKSEVKLEIIQAFFNKTAYNGESPEKIRDQFVTAFKDIIQISQPSSAIAVFVDGIETVDDLSMRVLSNLLSDLNVSIVATGQVDKTTASLFEVFPWEPATVSMVQEICRQKFGVSEAIASQFVEQLVKISEGKTGRINQYLDDWFISGDLLQKNHEWFIKIKNNHDAVSLTQNHPLFEKLQKPVRKREIPAYDRLDREILRLISACQVRCSFNLLAGVFAARENLLLEVIDRLIRSGWIKEVSIRNRMFYEFIEEIDKDQIYQSMSIFHQRYIHRRIADVLNKSEDKDIDEIADHLSLSDHIFDGVEVIDQAARVSRDRFENKRALNLYMNLLQYLDNALTYSQSLPAGPDEWMFTFNGLSYGMLSESAKNARRRDIRELKRLKLRIIRDQGNIYGRTGEYGAAFDAFQHLLAAARDDGRKALEGDALRLIGQILFYQRKLEESEKYFKEALEIREEISDQAGIADCLNALGVLSQQKNNLDIAMDYFRDAIKIKQALNDEKGYVYILNNIANIYYNRGDLKQSLEEFNQSASVFRKLNDELGLAYCLYNIGGVNIELKNFSDAIEPLEESLEIRRKMQDLQDIGHCLWQLATAYQGADRVKEAIASLEEAIEVLENVGLSGDADECREMLEGF